eukprot:Pgem_evm1s15065
MNVPVVSAYVSNRDTWSIHASADKCPLKVKILQEGELNEELQRKNTEVWNIISRSNI